MQSHADEMRRKVVCSACGAKLSVGWLFSALRGVALPASFFGWLGLCCYQLEYSKGQPLKSIEEPARVLAPAKANFYGPSIRRWGAKAQWASARGFPASRSARERASVGLEHAFGAGR